MKFIKYIRTISYSIILLSVLNACTGAGKIDISVNAENEFPVIGITNTSGKEILIHPASSSTGSIGFQKDGSITWLKGMPSKSKNNNGESYLWEINDEIKVELRANKDNDDLLLQLSLISNNNQTADILLDCLVIGLWSLVIIWLLFLVSWLFSPRLLCSLTRDSPQSGRYPHIAAPFLSRSLPYAYPWI